MHKIDRLPLAWKEVMFAKRDEDLSITSSFKIPTSPLRRKSFKAENRLQGMLLGCAIGDALGMPLEGVDNRLTMRSIRRFGGIRDFLAPQYHALRSLHRLRPGCWTEDTQLTIAIMKSLIERGTIDYEHIADAHVQAFEMLELRGWDATTKHACRRLSQGTSRLRSGKIGGHGNGVATKISPIAAWSLLHNESEEQFLNHCLQIGMMTHKDSRAIVGAFVVGLLIWDALRSTRGWDPNPKRYEVLIKKSQIAEKYVAKTLGVSRDPLSKNLIEVSDALDSSSVELAKLCNNATSYVCNSIPYVAAFLSGKQHEFESGVLETINGGGDTDTNAAIVGAVLGSAYGIKKLPKHFAERVEEAELLREISAEFAAVCTK